MLVALMMVGCGEEAKKEAVQEEAKDDPSVPLLIPCEACGGDVAKKTEECLKCGHPTPDSVVAYKDAQELARIRAERERERREDERKLAAIRAEDERKQEAQREELRVRYTNAAYAKLGDRFTISDLGIEMIWVKHGAFMMGGELSQHQVTLTKGFYLGKYEVTQAQWERVMGNNPSHFKGADRPVGKVSWNDAVEFCKKLTEMEKKAGRLPQGMSYQLPTEAQWEYACRAGTKTVYSWGDTITKTNANYRKNVVETTPVGKYPANPWGFHDMHGNVSEWCADWYGDYPSGAVTDSEGQASGSARGMRGGSCYNTGSNLRPARRNGITPSFRYNALGFRVGFQSSK